MDEEKNELKLDQIMRVLFKLSKKVIVNLMNGLFDEKFEVDEVELSYSNGEFISDTYERITGDMYITIRKEQHVYRYHIEFQTLNDQSMAIRMFRYGFEKAVEVSDVGDMDEIKLEFPRQLVIFLEENERIKDEISFILKLPSGDDIRYNVPVVKYWKFTPEYLRDKKMYALLPLQVFKARKKIKSIYNSSMAEAEKGRLINEEFKKLIETISLTIDILREIHGSKEIFVSDLEKILRVITNITEYLYNKYGEYNNIGREVVSMVTTLYNPLIKEEGKIEGKVEGKIEGKVEDILEILKEHGNLGESLTENIKKETSLEILKRWLKLAAKVESIDEFIAQMYS